MFWKPPILNFRWGNVGHLEVDDNGSKEDADGLDEVAEHVNEGRRDIDVFTWLVDVTNIEMTNYDCNCGDDTMIEGDVGWWGWQGH